jgi:hypothetical protein
MENKFIYFSYLPPSDAGELPRRKHTTFRTWRKFEIKNTRMMFHKIKDCRKNGAENES